MFSCEFCEILRSKNLKFCETFTRTTPVAASDHEQEGKDHFVEDSVSDKNDTRVNLYESFKVFVTFFLKKKSSSKLCSKRTGLCFLTLNKINVFFECFSQI